jgi:hypothetical protein
MKFLLASRQSVAYAAVTIVTDTVGELKNGIRFEPEFNRLQAEKSNCLI